MKIQENNCKNCDYWQRIPKDEKKGICHCKPPIAMAHLVPNQGIAGGPMRLDTIETTSWPATNAEAWCGEFKEE